MTQFDLRQAILHRVQDSSIQELTDTIEASVDGDEQALPGLGVLFEIIWQQVPEATQEQLVQTLHSHLHGHHTLNAIPSY